MKGLPVQLGRSERRIILRTIRAICTRPGWSLYAAHVRRNHVHVVGFADERPERVLGRLKSSASAALNRAFEFRARRWSAHGSTRWLWEPRQIDDVIDYVVRRQGQPMAVYEDTNRWKR